MSENQENGTAAVEYEAFGETISQKDVFEFLNDLRDSGAVNMFGAGEYLQESFGMDRSTARRALLDWMKSFEAS